jgi:hypothetical protein
MSIIGGISKPFEAAEGRKKERIESKNEELENFVDEHYEEDLVERDWEREDVYDEQGQLTVSFTLEDEYEGEEAEFQLDLSNSKPGKTITESRTIDGEKTDSPSLDAIRDVKRSTQKEEGIREDLIEEKTEAFREKTGESKNGPLNPED